MPREVEDVYADNDLILSLGEVNAFGLLIIIYIACISVVVTQKQIRGEFKPCHFWFTGLKTRNGSVFVNAKKDDFSSRAFFLVYRIVSLGYWLALWLRKSLL